MDCWHCRRTAVGSCRFCGRGICEDHVQTHPYILELFKAHGGVEVFGYPISRRFLLRGEWVQLFQRVGVRLLADGRAEVLPLLDELPLRRLNGSELPEPDPALTSRWPRPDEPGFARRAEALLQDLARHHGMWHRTPIPDLLIAETALHHGLGVIHVDATV